MPAVSLYGRRWHFSTDIMPLPAALAAAYHLPWVLILVIGPAASGRWPGRCESWQGAAYVALFALMLAAFAAGLVVDVLLFLNGLKGE